MSALNEQFAQVREALNEQYADALNPSYPVAALDALDRLEQHAARTEKALDRWERDGHVFVRIADVRAALAEEETA